MKATPRPKFAIVVACTGLVGGALALRLIFFGGLLAEDDIMYWGAAQGLRSGDHARGGPAYATRHGLVVPLALAHSWFGETERAAALVPLAYSLAQLVLAYALGQLYGGAAVGLSAAALLAILPLDVIGATDLHRDLPLAVWLAAAFYGVKRGELSSRHPRVWFFLGGLALGIAYVTKETALAFLLVLLLRTWWFGTGVRGYPWLAAGLFAVLVGDVLWFWWMTGIPFYRYSSPVLAQYQSEGALLSQPSYTWMLGYLAMLLWPLSGAFPYFAGIFLLVLAALVWGLRQNAALQELCFWWGTMLLAVSLVPLDLSFTRPAAPHFPRYLHPVLVPFALTVAIWLVRGFARGPWWRAGVLTAFTALALAGTWTAHVDYRIWAAPAREAAAMIAGFPAGTVVATDHTTAWLLHVLAPHTRATIVPYVGLDLAASGPLLVLRDPAFLPTELRYGRDVPAAVLSPPARWEKVAEFTRPRRPGLRSLARAWLRGASVTATPVAEPVVLWRVPTNRDTL